MSEDVVPHDDGLAIKSTANDLEGGLLEECSGSGVVSPLPPSSEGSTVTEQAPIRLSFKQRIRHWTWPWYTLTMATGGIAAGIYNVPDGLRFTGLFGIGAAFMLLAIAFFIMNVVLMSCRFHFHPGTFRDSLLHPTESLFVPASVISVAVILTNITQYGLASKETGPWLIWTMAVLFWVYIGLALAFSCGIYLLMWSTQTFTISTMTPVWIFPSYPLLLAGPFAGVLSDPVTGRTGASALRIIITGVTVQGIGFMVSLTVYSAYLYRLMTQKLPSESSRPAMFISVGPSGFTITALISMGQNFAQIIPTVDPHFMGNGELAAGVTRILANWTGIWLWGLAVWFFLVSAAAHYSCVSHGRLHFQMTWNSFVFPNSALVMATFSVSKALSDNRPLAVLGCVMLVALVAAWVFVMVMAVRAILLRQILWPDKQEDAVEHHHLARPKVGRYHSWLPQHDPPRARARANAEPAR